MVADVADANSVREGEKKIAEKFPDGVDVLINNAGRGLHSAFAEADSQQLSAIVNEPDGCNTLHPGRASQDDCARRRLSGLHLQRIG